MKAQSQTQIQGHLQFSREMIMFFFISLQITSSIVTGSFALRNSVLVNCTIAHFTEKDGFFGESKEQN